MKQIILWNESGRLAYSRSGISNQNQNLKMCVLFKQMERGYSKLFPREEMTAKLGRSTFNHFSPYHYYFALPTNWSHIPFCHKVQTHQVQF